MSKHIQCSMCLRKAPPSRRDAVICADCSLKLYARLGAATGDDIDGIALLDKMFADSQHVTPAEAIHGDGEFMYADEMFEVRRG